MKRYGVLLIIFVSSAALFSVGGAQTTRSLEMQVATQWYNLMLNLTRHTATYSPPVAARTFAYIGLIAQETVASQRKTLRSMAGQLNGFQAVSQVDAKLQYSTAAVLHGAFSSAIEKLYGNTGPTGQRVFISLNNKLSTELSSQIKADILERSLMYGRKVATEILAFAATDGGASISNLGFPLTYPKASNPQDWIPTAALGMQQTPLLPNWGQNRPLVMKTSNGCALPAPLVYSSDKASAFYKEALEVYETVKNISPEQKQIARFWSDDPMLTVTPPGHWINIVLNLALEKNWQLEQFVESQTRVGLAVNDAFIGCWQTKYQYNLLRPITYIRRHIDPAWEAILPVPPFPEYPSGHSTQSGAAAGVLTAMLGENYAFTDTTGSNNGLAARKFVSFNAAAEEAGISRLYGGIHYRTAVTRGLEQGRCIAAKINALKFR